jgi:CRP-like cAMP-binding protein
MSAVNSSDERGLQPTGWPPAWGFRASTLEILERSAATLSFERGRVVAAAGRPRPLILVTDGYVAVRRTEPAGRTFTLLVLRRGHVVAFRTGEVALADFVGLSSGKVALIPAPAIRDLVVHDPQFALRMVDESSEALRQVYNRLHEVTFDSAAQRLAIALLAYQPLLAGPRPVLSRTDLASLIGTSREMLGRLARRFESLGAIERVGRSIIVKDRAALMVLGAWDDEGREHYEALRGPAGDDPQFDP